MINPTELAVCKRRGHNARLLADRWAQCEWCGIWIREVRTVEEREDAPPEADQSPLARSLKEQLVKIEDRKARSLETKELLTKLRDPMADPPKKKKKGKKK